MELPCAVTSRLFSSRPIPSYGRLRSSITGYAQTACLQMFLKQWSWEGKFRDNNSDFFKFQKNLSTDFKKTIATTEFCQSCYTAAGYVIWKWKGCEKVIKWRRVASRKTVSSISSLFHVLFTTINMLIYCHSFTLPRASPNFTIDDQSIYFTLTKFPSPIGTP